jgi:hypothetical protein
MSDVIFLIMTFGPFVVIPFFLSQFAGVMQNEGFDDPVYKHNLQRLIERNREFEKTRNEPHS